MKIIKNFCLILLSILAILCFFIENHTSKSEIKQSFEIDKPYLSVLKDFSTKNSLEKIIEQNNAVLLDKKWQYLNLEVIRIRKPRQWNIDGKLNFTVETQDESLGKQKLDFYQDVSLKNDTMNIKTGLISSSKNIVLCERTIKFVKKDQEDKTLVEIEAKLSVKKIIPKFLIQKMDKKLNESNEKEVENLKNNILAATKGSESLFSIPINVNNR